MIGGSIDDVNLDVRQFLYQPFNKQISTGKKELSVVAGGETVAVDETIGDQMRSENAIKIADVLKFPEVLQRVLVTYLDVCLCPQISVGLRQLLRPRHDTRSLF